MSEELAEGLEVQCCFVSVSFFFSFLGFCLFLLFSSVLHFAGLYLKAEVHPQKCC